MSDLILSSGEIINSVDEWVYEDDEGYLSEDYNEMSKNLNLAKVGKIMNDEEGKNLPKFTQYVLKDGHYMPMQSTIEVLPAGYYKPEMNHYNGEIYATPKDVVLPKLYDLPNDIHKTVLDDIKHFWASEERYKKFGNVYKRNILLYSVPGNGKTSLINILANELIKEHNGIIISIDDEEALEVYPKLMQRVRQVEPDRKVITIIEDFERLIRKDYLSALLLQILDGSEQFNNVVTIATTNYPNDIGEQYTARPSRFNIKIEYKKPNEEVRKFYITQKLADAGIEIDDKVGEDIDRLVKKSEGYTFDFVKEVVQGIYVDDIPEDEIFERINDAIKRKGRYNTTENEPTQVGFSAK